MCHNASLLGRVQLSGSECLVARKTIVNAVGVGVGAAIWSKASNCSISLKSDRQNPSLLRKPPPVLRSEAVL